ncbi:hypothetical protein MMC18_003329 [Xylographa bjoerkii]|nr:hypothetical protein [Xylographa bjoerkii]
MEDVLESIRCRLSGAPQPHEEHTPRELHPVGNASQATSSAVRLDPVQIDQKKKTSDQILKLSHFLGVQQGIDVAAFDVFTLLGLARNLNPAFQIESANLICSMAFCNWLSNKPPEVLCVKDGTSPESIDEWGQSPVSFACAKFLEAIDFQSSHNAGQLGYKVFSVRWFCGEHTDLDPKNMMKELIAQLLLQIKNLNQEPGVRTDIDFAASDLAAFSNDNIDDLNKIFYELIEALPEDSMTFCVLDRISFYEDERRLGDLSKIIKHLFDIPSKNISGKFKLLVTAPACSFMFVGDLIADTEPVIPEAGGSKALHWSTTTNEHE